MTVHLVYSDVAGEEMAQRYREELQTRARELLQRLRQPVDHFGALFDPIHCTFTE